MESSLYIEDSRKNVVRIIVHLKNGTKIYARQVEDMGTYFCLNGKVPVPKDRVSEIDELYLFKKIIT